ncbi:MAG: CHAT domain-containing protein [Actinoallomurus sp.]
MGTEPKCSASALTAEIETRKAWIVDVANAQSQGTEITGQEVFDHVIAQAGTSGWPVSQWQNEDQRLPDLSAALARIIQLKIHELFLQAVNRHRETAEPSRTYRRFAFALKQLAAEDFSPDKPIVQLSIDNVRVLVTAVIDDAERYQITLHVNPFPASVVGLTNSGLALRSASGLLHTATVDAGGLAVFHAMPAGAWRIQAVPPMAGRRSGVPLPAVRGDSDAISAAEHHFAIRTPGGVTLVVSEPAPGAFELEATSTAGEIDVLGLRYQTNEAEYRTLYIPVRRSGVGPPAARVHLHNFAPTAPWEADDTVSFTDPGLRDIEILAQSVKAAADRGTRRAWRSLAGSAPDDVGTAIREAVGAGERRMTSRGVEEPTDDLAVSGPVSRTGRDTEALISVSPPPEESTPPARDVSPQRFLTADLPVRAPVDDVVSLMVRITTDVIHDRYRAHQPVKPFTVPSGGTPVLIVVEAHAGLLPLDRLERLLRVPADGDSEPIRFPFRVRTAGLLTTRITAWLGPQCVGELTVEVSAEPNGPTVSGPSRRAGLGNAGPELGEVTLQVRRGSGGGYSFQLMTDSVYYDAVADHEGGVVSESIERTLSMLGEFAARSTAYTDSTARISLKEIGVGLWQELVPSQVKEQFWELRDKITSFSIATDHDIVPWELIYPLASRHDYGFLVEQFPVVRRVYNQTRSRRISVRKAAFVIPQDAPLFAHEETIAINRLLKDVLAAENGEIISRLEPLKQWIDSGQAGLLHFASHNQFALTAGGSSIAMADGEFLPMMLNSSIAREVLSRHPLVFINACRSAGAAYEYTRPMSWASKFMAAGAGAFVGTLWAVRSEVAQLFSEAFYDALLRQGLSFGTAMTVARRAVQSDRDPSWLAYTAYSHPEARCAEISPPEVRDSE